MLTAPPCIRGLIGCDESTVFQSTGDTGGGGSTGGSGSSGGSFTSGGGSSGSSGGNSSGFTTSSSSSSSSRSSSSFSFGTSNGGNNLAARLSSGTERVARYTVSAVNRGTEAVKGFIFSHGPLPSAATFDPARSSKECVQVGTEVQCATDLQPGETKNFKMVYKVNNSVSCAIARALQSVKNITVGSPSNVVMSVNCTMKTESKQSGISSSVGTSLTSGNTASGTYVTGTSGTGMASSGTGAAFAGTSVTDITKAQDAGKTTKGGKGYKQPSIPRTGATDTFFQAVVTQDVLTEFTPNTDADVSSVTLFVGVFFSAVLCAAFIRRRLLA